MLKQWQIDKLENLDNWIDFYLNKNQSELANDKKQQLLEMAKNSKDKPNKKHPLGIVFIEYTNSNSSSYDAKFDKKIRELRPDWFVTRYDKTIEKKQQILELARNGGSRPVYKKHPLGRILCSYTNPNSSSYDPEFTKQIKQLRPDWFIDAVNEKQQQLLEMARNGEDRPKQKKHPLGMAFVEYTNPKKNSYNAEFTKKIRELRPDWFVTQFDAVNEKKQQILEMARNGEDRPNQRTHPLGRAFGSYICRSHSSYDPIFDKQIRQLRPDWFK